MARPLIPLVHLRRCFLPALLALSGALGCVDHNPTGTTLFVFDGASQSVQIWADVNTVFTATSGIAAAPDRTITSSLLTGVKLGWGGLAVDANSQRIYLVSETGTIYVINKANTQNGAISLNTDIYTLSLGVNNSDRFANGAFGQAALDQSQNTLYVMETSLDGSNTRVWTIPNVSSLPNQYQVPVSQTFTVSGDTWGSGLAVVQGGGGVIGLFGAGNQIYDPSGNAYTGARMWLGSGTGFPTPVSGYVQNGVIIGKGSISGFSSTAPLTYGSLAFDSQRNTLYAFGQGSPQVVVFNKSQFTIGGNNFNQTPVRTLADTSLTSLRVLSHPANGDWLLGANYTTAPSATATGTGGPNLLIWKEPSGGGSATSVSLPTPASGTAPEIRGMAIGGTN